MFSHSFSNSVALWYIYFTISILPLWICSIIIEAGKLIIIVFVIVNELHEGFICSENFYYSLDHAWKAALCLLQFQSWRDVSKLGWGKSKEDAFLSELHSPTRFLLHQKSSLRRLKRKTVVFFFVLFFKLFPPFFHLKGSLVLNWSIIIKIRLLKDFCLWLCIYYIYTYI